MGKISKILQEKSDSRYNINVNDLHDIGLQTIKAGGGGASLMICGVRTLLIFSFYLDPVCT